MNLNPYEDLIERLQITSSVASVVEQALKVLPVNNTSFHSVMLTKSIQNDLLTIIQKIRGLSPVAREERLTVSKGRNSRRSAA